MDKQTKEFKTEVQQLLDLVIHSLYSNPDIFLREIVSNASDAIDRARFEAITNDEIQEPEGGWRIKITPDAEDRTLTITDTGIGMNAAEIEANIGTIANSGTRKFLEELQKGDSKETPELIGQFGVGFYSAFMAAEKVTVYTKRAGTDDPALKWESKGDGAYTLEETQRDVFGTDIVLHLQEDKAQYLEEWSIRQIIKKYSDYVAFPIVMDITREEPIPSEEGEDLDENEPPKTETVVSEETLNSMKAIWTRSKSEVSEEDYFEFYKAQFHDYQDPAEVIHYRAEGNIEFNALLYLPSQPPFDMFSEHSEHGVQLYVKRVFIMDKCKELLPPYLRFVKGVVDSSDLPLNVSREILQEDALIRMIQKNLVKRILKTLSDTMENDLDKYLTFYKEFGRVLKEGAHSDHENRDKIHDLLLFESSKTEPGKLISLQDYVANMHPDQKEIYFISGNSREAVEHSPLLEAFKSKGYDVLFMIDPIDEWVMQNLTKFEDKDIKAVHRGEVDLHSDEEKEEKEEARKEASEKFNDLTSLLQKQLDEDVKEVRISDRLTDSAVCLVADQNDLDPNMERIMRAMGQEVPKTKRIMEINPEHEFIQSLLGGLGDGDEKFDDYAHLLYEQALVSEGSPPKDPARFTRLLTEMMLAHNKV